MKNDKAAANVDVTIDSSDALYSGGNDPMREKSFSGMGLGLFIHWSVDTRRHQNNQC